VIELPQRRCAVKDLRKNHTNRMKNLDIKTDLKKTIKTFIVAAKSTDKTDAQAKLTLVYKKLDKAAKRNILHKNTASRRKSRFSKMLAEAK
jgi:small subunit ribosomal protein S20